VVLLLKLICLKIEDLKRIKVLYLPRWYPNRYDPMPGLFIERHARSVSHLAEISVLYVHADEALKGKNFDAVISRDDELLQVKVYYKYAKSGIKFYNKITNVIRFLRSHIKGYRLINKHSGVPDLIHVNVLTRLGFLAFIFKLFTGKPYVITEHWTRYLPATDSFDGFIKKRITQIVVRYASAVLPVTFNLQKAMETHGLKNWNYKVIPNVVDIEKFKPSSKSTLTHQAAMVHVSCFDDKQKNISGLLRVLKKLSASRQDWHCQMVGDGIDFEKLKKYAENIKLREPFIYFQGLKENNELIELMSNADFQVMFSRYENLPVVILESYACGVPVLSTNVGGIYEHMNNDLGMLIPSEDEDELFDKLNTMIDNRHRYDKKVIRLYAEEHFSEAVIGKQLYEVYKQVTG
jgi:glycosyltransferase involved in cell wall biosynthesis